MITALAVVNINLISYSVVVSSPDTWSFLYSLWVDVVYPTFYINIVLLSTHKILTSCTKVVIYRESSTLKISRVNWWPVSLHKRCLIDMIYQQTRSIPLLILSCLVLTMIHPLQN